MAQNILIHFLEQKFMNEAELKSWDDYWKLFDNLCETLCNNNKKEIAHQLKEAQKYVNGLSDGWYEFLFHFKRTVESNIELLDEKERKQSELLITSLHHSLNR
jgi:hypothetical protein